MGPRLAFDQDDLRWLEALEIAADHRREIERCVGDAQVRDGRGAGHGVAGGGAGGEHEAPVRFAGEPGADEFQGEHGFAHADGVEMHRAVGFGIAGGVV